MSLSSSMSNSITLVPMNDLSFLACHVNESDLRADLLISEVVLPVPMKYFEFLPSTFIVTIVLPDK